MKMSLVLLLLLAACASSKSETIPIQSYQPGAELRPTIYMFSSGDCEPCQEAKSIVEREARRRGDRVVIVDAEDDRQVKKLGYSSLPVFRFVKPGAPDLVVRGWDRKRFAKAYEHFDGASYKKR